MKDAELDDLLVRYADGTLDAAELTRLEAELERSATARSRMRELTEQAFAVGEAARCRDARSSSRRVVEFPATKPSFTYWRPVLAWVAMITAVMAIFVFAATRSPESILEVVAVRGTAVWSDGDKRVPLLAGRRLAAGTIETESETATVELRLADGTHFTMNGSAEAAFSERDGKQVTLKRGKITASVTPQSPERPLRVRTPTAIVEVLGTVFSLDAVPQRTGLSVAQGRVRLRRLVDGREVEVSAEQQVAASLVSTDALVPREMKAPPARWTLGLATEPHRLTGTWIAAGGDEPAHIAATPFVEKREDNGSIYVHHGVIVRAASDSPNDSFATLTPDSVLRVNLRMQSAFPLQLMISTRRPDGGFAGNFELIETHPQIVPGQAWQTLEVPIRDLVAVHPERAKVAAGNHANVVIITTMNEPVGLEVAEISIAPAASAQ